MQNYRIALIPGDGVGQEVIPAALRVLNRAAEITGTFSLDTHEFPWSCEFYLRTGAMMDPDGIKKLADVDAIFLGAVGYPNVPDHISLWGLLLPIRQNFDQYVNLRPIKLLPGVKGPLRDKSPADIDMLFLHENTEGEYCGHGGRLYRGTPDEVATQTAVFTRKGTERIVRYAFERARERRKMLASCTKSNALNYSMVFWDEVVADVAHDYPDVKVTSYLVDALSARMILHPDTLDVVVASNLFGDILTDLGGALQGSLGLPASGNINPPRRYPSMFEPVHGSAPDISGRGIANPLATIWAGIMMLEQLGEPEAAGLVMAALERVVAEGKTLTTDLGGSSTTGQVADAVAAALAV
ncbi:MAG: tartrate dehydrogenase [Chloroflexota bacterium]|nr:tartrate dehydrogenase [Chloroflexota bacterium]